jgi:RNA polymerase sigma-70 factor (ECF subfamily)
VLRARREGAVLRRRRRGGLRVPLSSPAGADAPDVAAVWQEFQARLLAFIARRVPDRDSAEDILQEVMLRIHRHAGDLEDSAAVGAWIHQIARNAIADHYRHAATRREQPSGVVLDGQAPAAAEAPSGELRSELAGCLRPLIERLASPYREAITLTELDGISQTAAAEDLGLSVSGMKSRVQRARAQLGELLVSCCEIELDRRGGITSYQPRRDPCDCRTPPDAHR